MARSSGGDPAVDEAASIWEVGTCDWGEGTGKFEAFNCCNTFAVICEVIW